MFSIIKKIFNKIEKELTYQYYKLKKVDLQKVKNIKELMEFYPGAFDRYIYCFQSHFKFTPRELLEHRRFFEKNRRGFGETAFHSMWWLIFNEYRPEKILEIGVYRGQTITLFAMIGKILNYKPEVHGLSPFSRDGDTVSNYVQLDYFKDVQENINTFKCENIFLHRCYSNDKLGLEVISNQSWDLIYIDGSHDYDVVLSDFNAAHAALKKGGILVMDDSARFYGDSLPGFAFVGHPGPSAVANEIAKKKMEFVTSVGHNSVFRKIN